VSDDAAKQIRAAHVERALTPLIAQPSAFQYRFVNPAPAAPLAEAWEGAEFAVQLCQDTSAAPPSLIVFRHVGMAWEQWEQHECRTLSPHHTVNVSGNRPAPVMEAPEDIEFVPDRRACLSSAIHPQDEVFAPALYPPMGVSLRLDERDMVWRDVPHPENLLNQVWCDRLVQGHLK
jgi:hypothetical protein